MEDYLVAAADSIRQDPTTSLAALEAVARICSTCMNSRQQLLLQPASLVAATVLRVLAHQEGAADMLAQPSVQQQLLSLLLCQLKLLIAISEVPQTTLVGSGVRTAYGALLADMPTVSSTGQVDIIDKSSHRHSNFSGLKGQVYCMVGCCGQGHVCHCCHLEKAHATRKCGSAPFSTSRIDLARQQPALALLAAENSGKAT